jgi:hypothetical protein
MAISHFNGVVAANISAINAVAKASIDAINGITATFGGGGNGLLTDLIASWEMDEASGNAIDSHGSNDLTDNGSGLTAGGWRNFENSYFSKADNTDLSTGNIDFTFQMWINPDDWSAAGGFSVLAGKGATSVTQQEWVLIKNGAAGPLEMAVYSDGTDGTIVYVDNTTGGSPSTGNAHMITVWHDSVNNLIGIALDNGAADTVSHSLGVFDGIGDFTIGAAQSGGLLYDGKGRRGRFWKRVLSSGDRTASWNGGAGLAYGDLTA